MPDHDPAELKQYELLALTFNDEVTRFWARFNILMGLQMGGFVGILASTGILSLNPSLFRLALILMTLYSVSTLVVISRGHLMHEALLKGLALLEQESEGRFRMLSTCRRASKVPIGLNQQVAIVIAVVFVLAWISFLVWAEINRYAFSIAG
ncbi:MAG: hypothetical protein E4H08_08920 [Candidatus Atribacteria bacterium]|nr:MAG: hypothetical protein E4H08_08920 [Candidatus Atribacteria bacterium]